MATKRGLSRFASVMQDADGGSDLPQKTIQPVASGLLAPAAAQQQRAGMDAAQFLKAIQPNPYGRRSDVALKALGEFAGFGGDPMSADSRAAINDVIEGNQSGRYYANEGGVNYAPELSGSLTYNQQLLDSLNGYTFNPTSDTERTGYSITAPDGRSRVINWGTADSSFDKFAQTAIPIALAALGGAAFGGYIPGAEIGAAGGGAAAGGAGTITGGGGLTAGGSAGYGTIGGTLGGTGGTTLGVAGGGMSAGAGLTSPLLQSMAAIGAGSVLPASMQTTGALLDGLPMITADPAAAIEAYVAANPVTAESLVATLPEISMPVVAPSFTQAPEAFNAAKDSQLASSELGITGAQSAAAATAPATVNLGTLGGTMGTAGGLEGLLAGAKQTVSDTLGGGLLGDASAWMKANPVLGRLLMSGASGLLSGSGGGSSGGQAAAPSGPPVQWSSPLQQGLLSPVQQYAPPAIQQNRPAGLLAQGFQNDGAWRYLKG